MSDTLVSTEARAVGMVTDYTFRRSYGMDHRVDVLFYPSVRFQSPDGRTVEFQNKLGTNVPPRVGDEVPVIYDPARPEEAKVALGSMFKFNPKALLIVSGIFLAAMALFFLLFVAVLVWASVS